MGMEWKVLLCELQSCCGAGTIRGWCHYCRKGTMVMLAGFKPPFLAVCFPDGNLDSLTKTPLEAHVCNVLCYRFLTSRCV